MSQEVYSFSEFRLNEGIFDFWKKKPGNPISNIFKKEDDDLAERVINYLKLNFNERDLEYNLEYVYKYSKVSDDNDVESYKYLIRPRPKNQDIDPLGEEDWGDGREADTIITLKQFKSEYHYGIKRDRDKKMYINDTPLINIRKTIR